ncbi:MAG TPA: HD domain-containing phosphohydrolase [Ornithinimicrobium sp.]|uniref:HD-GYP domain-containing protein n=1 Tax=Ornithinimicrobium sp. TaxID=1977084 RepID=UPI002B49771E|nr:HD domain-containing phosphohydrolase [Ornithinimicrobium sp.]HKJ13169.1 HD domain-containing phosphohydrolase [Ornithinimicrobium sp.]
MSSSPAAWRLFLFIGAVSALALALGWWGFGVQKQVDWQAVVVLSALGALGTNLRESDFGAHLEVSFTTVVLTAATVLAGPGGAVLVGYLSFLLDFRRGSLDVRLFNPAMTACVSGAGAAVYLGAGGLAPVPDGITPLNIFAEVALPMLAGYLVSIAVNALLVGVMMRLHFGGNAVSAAVDVLRDIGASYLVHVVVAFLLVVLWGPGGLGAFSAVLIVVPLLLTQWAISRNAAQRHGHARIVGTLMGALEVATPYSSGHSARVADLSARMGTRLGITGEDAAALHFAALLHDLGLVSTSPQVPKGTTAHDVRYLAAVQEHPEAGVQMLSDIDFLVPALPGILHHHERFDGLGYPAGLAGSDIHLFARVIAVADAFDSLTTNRSYRSESSGRQALAECWERAGTHLDPEVVQALADSLAETPWETTRISEETLADAKDVNDHDDPAVSDAYAAWQPEPSEDRA